MLIVGALPPPIGGVTRYVERLADRLRTAGVSALVWDRRRHPLAGFLRQLRRASVVHINLSDNYAIAACTVLSRLNRIPIVITVHGNVERFRGLRLRVLIWAARLASRTIVLNRASAGYLAGQGIGKVQMLSAFIPPTTVEALPPEMAARIDAARAGRAAVFCTATSNLTFDVQGRETYGIAALRAVFAEHPEWALVVSDPSREYVLRMDGPERGNPENVVFLAGPHDFNAVLQRCDILLRTTSTDGDSIAVREGLHWGRPVIASDVVDRPEGVVVYRFGGQQDLVETMTRVAADRVEPAGTESAPVVEALLKVYSEVTGHPFPAGASVRSSRLVEAACSGAK